jgi:hypothetical protein
LFHLCFASLTLGEATELGVAAFADLAKDEKWGCELEARQLDMRDIDAELGLRSAPPPTLQVSFELGANPDINTVNVNNRVQVALSKLPQDVQRQGVTVKKQSSALLGVIAVYSPKATHDPLFISNYLMINLLDPIKSTPGVGDATLWGPQDYAMRV